MLLPIALAVSAAEAWTCWHTCYGGTSIGLLVSAAALGGLGVLTLPIAIGLDVDRRSRRAGLRQVARIALTPMGLTVSGSF